MSDFTNALTNIVGKQGGNTALQRITGVHNAVISRLSSGENVASPETVEKLCKNLAVEDAVSLLLAWLNDFIPAPLRTLVRIEPSNPGDAKPEDPSFLEIFAKLDEKVQRALRQFAEEALSDSDFGKYFYEHARYMFPEWAKLEDAILDAQLAEYLASHPPSRLPDETELYPASDPQSLSKQQVTLGAVPDLQPLGIKTSYSKKPSKSKRHK